MTSPYYSSDFTRTIPGAGCLDLRLTVESGQPRVELKGHIDQEDM